MPGKFHPGWFVIWGENTSSYTDGAFYYILFPSFFFFFFLVNQMQLLSVTGKTKDLPLF